MRCRAARGVEALWFGRLLIPSRGGPRSSEPVQRASSIGPQPRGAGRIILLWGGGANSTPRHGPELGAGSDGGSSPAVTQSRLSAADQLRRSVLLIEIPSLLVFIRYCNRLRDEGVHRASIPTVALVL